MQKISVDVPPTLVPSNNTNIGLYPNGIPSGKITLNGPLVNASGEVCFGNYASSITFSGGNLAAVTFTIIGISNGVLITEYLPGVATGFSFTDNLFHTIISISANVASGAVTVNIGSNYFMAVTFNNLITNISKFETNYIYNIMLNSLSAADDWPVNSLLIYGVNDNAPKRLNIFELGWQGQENRNNKYFALNNPFAITSQASLNNGFITTTTYPFSKIIVFLSNGINTTPVFVEITQS